MTNKLLTAGEVHRLGLIKTAEGKPLKTKRSVIYAMKEMPHVRVNTPTGMAYVVTMAEVEKRNKAIKEKYS